MRNDHTSHSLAKVVQELQREWVGSTWWAQALHLLLELMGVLCKLSDSLEQSLLYLLVLFSLCVTSRAKKVVSDRKKGGIGNFLKENSPRRSACPVPIA